MYEALPHWLQEFLPILILLAVVAVVMLRLPKVDLGHSKAFMHRRVANWLPLGLTYAFLYMGRYNLTVATEHLGDRINNEGFGTVFGWGTLVYGVSFVINGPLTDRIGGRKTILIAAIGAACMNAAMGALIIFDYQGDYVIALSVLYALNMYFQSFGAVSIVKVNSAWFHVRERGVFGGIFGILISLGIYFAFDGGRMIVEAHPVQWVFLFPAIVLLCFAVIDFLLVRDTPGEAGQEDFDTADASSGDTGPRLPVLQVFLKLAKNPVIVTIALVEFCSGFLRNAIMHWGMKFASQTGQMTHFVFHNWGLLLCCAGIMGGVTAGIISDRVFGSRRGPVAALLYGVMLAGALAAIFLLDTPAIGWIVIFMSLAIIGVHGMLSGTASMDFGGKRNVGVAVGIIDGFVYLGTALQAVTLGHLLPEGDAAHVVSNWSNWPIAMVPAAIVGLALAIRVWHAMPEPNKTAEAS